VGYGSGPGVGAMAGDEVYRCFQLTIPSFPQADEHECIGRLGQDYAYVNSAVPAPSPLATQVVLSGVAQTPGHQDQQSVPTGAAFYSVPGWSCTMSPETVACQSARGEAVHLLPGGEVDICHVGGTTPNSCEFGNPGIGTPTLSYGTQLAVGPFRCTFSQGGLTCVVIKLASGFRLINVTTVTHVGPRS
jgi:hypothetical protein